MNKIELNRTAKDLLAVRHMIRELEAEAAHTQEPTRRGGAEVIVPRLPSKANQGGGHSMKDIVKTSRLAGSLEKLFRLLNADFFNNELETPIITIQSTPRAYGHYSVIPIWTVNGKEDKHEINIAAGTLDRPIENTVATLLHEMCHMYNGTVLHVQDFSRGGTYHNKRFKATAEAHGLICTHTDRYGWSDTGSVISDRVLEWILENNIQEIRLNRNEPGGSGSPAVRELPAGERHPPRPPLGRAPAAGGCALPAVRLFDPPEKSTSSVVTVCR